MFAELLPTSAYSNIVNKVGEVHLWSEWARMRSKLRMRNIQIYSVSAVWGWGSFCYQHAPKGLSVHEQRTSFIIKVNSSMKNYSVSRTVSSIITGGANQRSPCPARDFSLSAVCCYQHLVLLVSRKPFLYQCRETHAFRRSSSEAREQCILREKWTSVNHRSKGVFFCLDTFHWWDFDNIETMSRKYSASALFQNRDFGFR